MNIFRRYKIYGSLCKKVSRKLRWTRTFEVKKSGSYEFLTKTTKKQDYEFAETLSSNLVFKWEKFNLGRKNYKSMKTNSDGNFLINVMWN